MARITIVEPGEAASPLKEVYEEIIQKRGGLSEVLKIQSLHPQSIRSHMEFYMDVMFAHTALGRAEKEMIAVVVSAANGCRYCQAHHGAALQTYWKAADRVAALKEDYEMADLTEKEKALCRYAVALTRQPQDHGGTDHTQALRLAGCSDAAILDASLVTAYFNFVNRMVLSLGVALEAHGGEGYKY
jgi:uncharacterized peroxidase-related enzyme